jgi:hypothetical protein
MSAAEANTIANMFRLYDYKSTGRIPDYLAVKLIESLGVSAKHLDLPPDLNLNEIVSIVDKLLPEQEPMLVAALTTFNALASVKPKDELTTPEALAEAIASGNFLNQGPSGPTLTPQSISDFMESLGRPPISMAEATLMLNSMLDYDDCSEVPVIGVETFAKEVTAFAKKSNAFKDYRI